MLNKILNSFKFALSIVDSDKNEYSIHQTNSVKHKFGSEVKENSQFHHTTTEGDGVRLGCYGYRGLDGKLYATKYVADARGYRIINKHEDIPVYLKDGSERFTNTHYL
jgi:hypothetical protein